MVRVETVLARLEALDQYLAELEQLRHLRRDQFIDDLRNHRTAERDLQLAIQATIDVASHVVAADFSQRPTGYREVIQILGDEGVLPQDLADRLAAAAGFRNILIHEYVDVDLDIVYDRLQHGLDDFRQFSRCMVEYLRRSGALEG
ncbi:MAG: DUF86 domain-containing protein [Anaerolineae bacterium]